MENPRYIYRTIIEYGFETPGETPGRNYEPKLLPFTRALIKKKALHKESRTVTVTEKGKKIAMDIARKEGLLPLEIFTLMTSIVTEFHKKAPTPREEEKETLWNWAFCWNYYLLCWSPSLNTLLYSKGATLGQRVADSSPEEICIDGHGILYNGSMAQGDPFALLAPHYVDTLPGLKARGF